MNNSEINYQNAISLVMAVAAFEDAAVYTSESINTNSIQLNDYTSVNESVN